MRVAHQLRAPVAAIQSCLDVVLQGYLDHSPEQQRLLLQSARDSAAELLALSGDVLRLGELRDWPLATPQAPVDVGEVAAHLVEEWRAEAAVRAITITLEADPDLPPVLGQRLYLEEMLRNLVDNAVKYNLPGGSVRLRLTRVGDELRGEVRDTGIGIPSRDLPFIFDEFYRAENAKETITRGTGLGLPIVKQVVELHGGTIKASSNLGKGAAFTFLLPAATETEPGPASTPSRGTRPYETVGESRARGQE